MLVLVEMIWAAQMFAAGPSGGWHQDCLALQLMSLMHALVLQQWPSHCN